MKTKIKKTHKITILAVAFALFVGVQMIIPTKSEAQIRCSTDFFGNTKCVDTDTGNSSTTNKDFLGNDRTIFSDGTTMTCRTDFLGNYVCN